MEKDKLNKEQYIAVHHFKGPMLVLAGPGSGKTKVLTERIRVLIEEKNVNPEQILVITFSKKAAIEMRMRFARMTGSRNYPVNFGTFHAIFYSILKQHKNYKVGSIITGREKEEYVADAGIKLGIEKAYQLSWQRQMLEMISNYKNFGEDYFESNESQVYEKNEIEEFKKVYESYVRRCNAEEKIDFDDMILKCRELLYRHESILKEWKAIYKYILVDEFQDINDLQYDVLRLLAGDDKNVFCVGDDDQSIYAFRGARPELMKKFVRQFTGCRQVTLLTNYRCDREIVEAADRLIRHNTDRIERPQQLVRRNCTNGRVEVIESQSSILQAEAVCRKIKELIDMYSYSYNDFAVLYRSSHAAKMFETICLQKGIGIDTKERVFNLFEIKEIRVLISYLKAAIGTAARSDYFMIINNPPRGLSREALSGCNMLSATETFQNYYKYYINQADKISIIKKLEHDLEFIRELPPIAAIVYILKSTKLYDYFMSNYKKNLCDYSLDELLELLEDTARGFDSIDAFIDFAAIADTGNMKSTDKKDADGTAYYGKEKKAEALNEASKKSRASVKLMTAHASKGLEFPVVFIIGLQEGLFPHNKGLHGMALQEERRLMYVAMTRAKKSLYLCGLGIEHGKQKSRFIEEALSTIE